MSWVPPVLTVLSLGVVTSTPRFLPLLYSSNLDLAVLWALRALKQMAQPGLLLRLQGPAHSLYSNLACPPLGSTHKAIFGLWDLP